MAFSLLFVKLTKKITPTIDSYINIFQPQPVLDGSHFDPAKVHYTFDKSSLPFQKDGFNLVAIAI